MGKNIANLSNEIVYLKEQIEWFKRQIFGQKTEKFVEPNQNAHQLLFEGFDKLVPVEDEKKHTVATHERTKHRPISFQQLRDGFKEYKKETLNVP